MKKRLLSLLLLCTLVFALSGCGEKTLLNKKKPVSLSEKKIKERQEKFAVEKGKAGTIYTGDYAEALKSSNTPEEAIAKLSEMADGCISEYKKWAAKSYFYSNDP